MLPSYYRGKLMAKHKCLKSSRSTAGKTEEFRRVRHEFRNNVRVEITLTSQKRGCVVELEITDL